MKNRLVIFASGNGSNAGNLITYYKNSNRAEVVAVFTDKPGAGVIARCKSAGVEVVLFTKEQWTNENWFLETLKSYNPDLIILAGFLKLIPLWMIRAYPDKIINLHPALLPKFGGKGMYGMHVHRAVIESGEHQSGISFHYVNDKYDEGEIIDRYSVELEAHETAESLASKIHTLEMKWFPVVIDKLLDADYDPNL